MSFEFEEVNAKLHLLIRRACIPAEVSIARYIGMDVHKRQIVDCIVDGRGRVLKRSRCACTREILSRFARTHLTKRDHVALETTTNAWAVADLIRPHMARVVVSNPVKTRIIAEAKIKYRFLTGDNRELTGKPVTTGRNQSQRPAYPPQHRLGRAETIY